MKKIKFLLLNLLILIILSNCGFKRFNNAESQNYSIQNINIEGEKKIGYFFKNQVLLSSVSKSKNPINIDLLIDKKKEQLEKDISNKITKYRLTLKVSAEIKNLRKGKTLERTFVQSESYHVRNSHSITLKNEKKAANNLAEKISEDLIRYLRVNF
mgnify:FL=1|jgi:ABC-type ATPase involved in cell division